MILAVAVAFAEPPQPDEHLLRVPLGKSLVLTLPRAPLAVAITDPTVAVVQTLGTATVLQLQGKKIGTTDLVLTLPGGEVALYDVEVGRDLSALVRVIDHLVEGPPPEVEAPR